jgi:phage terminase large subunit
LLKSIPFPTNPVGKENWVYNTFFVHTDDKGKEHVIQEEQEIYKRRTLVNKKNGVYYHHSIADDNPFLPASYIKRLDGLKINDPHLWAVARWGRFGASGTRVLPQFTIATNAKQFTNTITNIPSKYHFFGLDFGFETSYNALISCAVDDKNKILYIYDEVYRNHMTDNKFILLDGVQRTKQRAENCKKPIFADSASPKDIQYYRQEGFNMFKNCVFKPNVNTIEWFKAASVRAVKTMAQAAIGVIGSSVVISSVDWKMVVSASVVAGVVSLLTSIAGIKEVEAKE